MNSDSEIVLRSRDHPAAFAEVYDRHASTVYRYAARRVGAEGADDVMSETFLVAFERRDRYDVVYDNALPWLLGIATVLIRKHRGAEARFLRSAATAAAAAAGEAVVDDRDDRLDARRAIGELATSIRRMPARDRDALLLYAWGDLDYEGVALAMDIPVGTVRSRLNRARRVLRQSAGSMPEEEVDRGRADIAPHGA